MPKIVDLFAGAGGMTEGFEQAGYQSALAIEYDEMAAKTFSFNHPQTPVFIKDIRTIQEESVREALKYSPIDVLCGGPPCQGFSLAGKRLTDDPRNQLFLEFVRMVNLINPRFFVFENVSGITSMSGGAILEAILQEFRTSGYECFFKVLNAADYGVPQARPRFFLIGTRDGEKYNFPDPSHAPTSVNDLFLSNMPRHLNVWDALSDLPYIEQGEGSEEMKNSTQAHNAYQLERRGNRSAGTLFNHRATGHSEAIVNRYSAIPEGGNNSQVPIHMRTKKINVFKLHREKPSRTVTCNHRTDLLHPVIPRGTTVREAARLQSFDDDYKFFGNLTRKAKWVTQDDQVGNAVPPLLARAIAKSLLTI
uniref:Cytosine-specific methyltransferase n=1 Tax=Paracoccus aminophilus JCM 7686 TaxID=1367847 RepID=E7BLE4_PARAH|nr:DNA cytosine methyltransferase [Paracoccus aminophilus]ADF47149.1 cytosine specific DNA methyltransferase [Paracoccus aminophilus JCM 7686]